MHGKASPSEGTILLAYCRPSWDPYNIYYNTCMHSKGIEQAFASISGMLWAWKLWSHIQLCWAVECALLMDRSDASMDGWGDQVGSAHSRATISSTWAKRAATLKIRYRGKLILVGGKNLTNQNHSPPSNKITWTPLTSNQVLKFQFSQIES